MTAFAERLRALEPTALAARLEAVRPGDVDRLLAAPRIRPDAAPILFAPAAAERLEALARRAHRSTLERFGRTIALYAPLYLSSHCVNRCAYCGFAAGRDVPRSALSVDQALDEADALAAQGLRHLLLVTGEAPAVYGLDELCAAARALRPRVASLAAEIFACDEPGYRRLAAAGVDGLVLYQETYLRRRYRALHPAGPKRDFDRRLAAVEAAGRAGMRSLGIGALLGLSPPRIEACLLAAHADHLTRTHPGARLAISFPRLRPVPGGAPARHPVDDATLVQLIAGMRLLFPDAELVVSTREPARLRDRLLPLGVTRISAGSRTSPGGYRRRAGPTAGQFTVDDQRSVAAVARAVRAAGYDVVCKDFDPALADGGWAR